MGLLEEFSAMTAARTALQSRCSVERSECEIQDKNATTDTAVRNSTAMPKGEGGRPLGR